MDDTLDYDNMEALIARLHDEAEDLAAQARIAPTPAGAAALRREAQTRVKAAARLREQSGAEA